MVERQKLVSFRKRRNLPRPRLSQPLDGVRLRGFDDREQITAVSVPRDAHGAAIRYALRQPRAVQNL